MNDEFQHSVPVFGARCPGVDYVDRPGAYAIIHDGEGRVAVVRTTSGLHLPGGGLEDGEPPEQALGREVLEECGWTISGTTHVCDATQYIYAPGEGYFAKHCTYYVVDSVDTSMPATDADHRVIWMEIRCAEGALLHESHRWALRQWYNGSRWDRVAPPNA